MHTALGSSRLRSSGAHCHPAFAKTIGRDLATTLGTGEEEEEANEEKKEEKEL